MQQLTAAFGGGRRPYLPQQSLPTDGWCQADGVARLNLVWPWTATPDPQPLVDAHDREVGITPVLELCAYRTDRDVVLIVWTETVDGPLVIGPDWPASIARLYGGRLEAASQIAIGGTVGRLARIADGRDTVWRLVLPRRGSVVHLEMRAPHRHASAYWLQAESMLATWSWAD